LSFSSIPFTVEPLPFWAFASFVSNSVRFLSAGAPAEIAKALAMGALATGNVCEDKWYA
jgi:hypothetical protein